MRRRNIKNKKTAKIPHTSEACIVELSLQNPQFGAKRLLPLLKSVDIDVSASTIYNILKRKGLQTREKRLARIRAQLAAETPPPGAVETPPSNAIAVPVPVEQPEPAPGIIKDKIPSARFLPVKKAPDKTKSWRSWFLTLSNILLWAMLVCLGFYTAQNLRNVGLESAALAAPGPVPAGIAARPETAAPPLTDYRIIGERNLFNVSKAETVVPEKEMAIAKIAVVQQDLGLKLIGTAVADDPRLSRAFIDNRSSGEQEAYREGDRAGDVRIIKIRRNKVIIATKDGNRLLTAEVETSAKGKTTSTAALQIAGSSTIGSQSPGSTFSGARTRSVSL